MKTKECKFKEFFDILGVAIENGDDVTLANDVFTLRCGFTVNDTDRYLMEMQELKYAQRNGVDVSQYMELK